MVFKTCCIEVFLGLFLKSILTHKNVNKNFVDKKILSLFLSVIIK